VIITDVDEGGPGAQGGVEAGDIVKSIDGFPIDSVPKYTAFLYIHQRGTLLRLGVLRKGQPVTLSISPADAPAAVDSLSDLINPKRDLIAPIGVFAMDVDRSTADIMPGLRSEHGVIVAGMLGEEPATEANLEVGDVVRSVNGKPLNSTQQLREDLAAFKPGDAVVLEVERQSVLMYVAFEME
jgi:serine protease Do